MIQQNQLQIQNYLDGDSLNFEQTKIWVKQQMLINKSPTPKRINRSQEFKNMKELASHPLIQNYCNQKRNFSQANLQRCTSIVSLNHIDEPQLSQVFQKPTQNQAQQQNSLQRQITNKSNHENQESKNKDIINISSKIQNKQLSIEKQTNQEDKSTINIHVQKLKQQKIQKFGSILRGLVSKKLSRQTNNNNITVVEQAQDNSNNFTKINSQKIISRPVSAININNTIKRNSAISPMSRMVINNNSISQNNTSFKNENSFILNLKIQSPNNQLNINQESLTSVNNGETPQSRKNSFQKLVIRPSSCKNAKISQYSTLNQSISLTQQSDQLQLKSQEDKLMLQIKLKDSSPNNMKTSQIGYSTPQNQQNSLVNKLNTTQSHKFLFYKSQNLNQTTQNDQNLLQNFQNQTFKKKLLDIHSVKETEEDTVQIQQKEKTQNVIKPEKIIQPKQGNMKFLQKLIQKIGSKVQDEKIVSKVQQDKQDKDQLIKIKSTQSIEIKKDNCDNLINERNQSIHSSAENLTFFSTAVQSNLISQKHSFHNSQVANTNSNISQIINSSPLYNSNQNLLFKRQQSLIQNKQQKSSSPKKVTSQLISSDLNSMFEKNFINNDNLSNENNMNIGKMHEQYREFSPIQKQRKLSIRQFQPENLLETIKNDNQSIVLSQNPAQQVSQSNRKLTLEDASTIIRNNSYSKISLEQKEEIANNHSRDNSIENQHLLNKNKHYKLNRISEEVSLQQKQSLSTEKFSKIHLKSSQSSTNLEISKADSKNYIKQRTLDQQKSSQNPNLSNLKLKKYGSMADLNTCQNKENETDATSQNDQKQFDLLKKEIMKNVIQDQKIQTLEQNIVIENSQQFQKLNSFQRKIVNKQYLDFLKNFKQFQKGIVKY
ncbi:hypothetical protein TTHERM_00721430 (macronuclear) [Tetrahymena thermophila SB210]|uniref:Uncharacterized protein n=1 Tax=Tetrahymena thermophila (strain SB210) TaxID=312017 RepID=Q22G14_TETTS|nr:hypothetical protein TTHERM_00721430 [Tetrahymena thermophila SB210]EAR84212.1 hypothetical protein TTHERM_00721430 [Tetrahymena thermophila SB210]|eukprot:XP_001031875.1 hypothetical protein TTHERM_00721430 [Tetrahymena thermophila SB210]